MVYFSNFLKFPNVPYHTKDQSDTVELIFIFYIKINFEASGKENIIFFDCLPFCEAPTQTPKILTFVTAYLSDIFVVFNSEIAIF